MPPSAKGSNGASPPPSRANASTSRVCIQSFVMLNQALTEFGATGRGRPPPPPGVFNSALRVAARSFPDPALFGTGTSRDPVGPYGSQPRSPLAAYPSRAPRGLPGYCLPAFACPLNSAERVAEPEPWQYLSLSLSLSLSLPPPLSLSLSLPLSISLSPPLSPSLSLSLFLSAPPKPSPKSVAHAGSVPAAHAKCQWLKPRP